MNKQIFGLIGLVMCFAPAFASAAGCSSDGATVVYVNGIETTEQQAKAETTLLRKVLLQSGLTTVQVITGYNPTHLYGLGDELESISQAFNAPLSDYDLYTILKQMASEVTTRKLLLVGHSQGSFYTNEIYKYFVDRGVSPDSVAVYNIATPADHVEGGGSYLTSANDKAINYVRQLEAEWGAPLALPANILVPEEFDYKDDIWAGHTLSVYLNGASKRIASDIKRELNELSADHGTAGDCFKAPAVGITYAVQRGLFTITDPLASNIEYAAADTRNTVASVADNANDILHMAFSNAIFTVIQRPTAQNAAGAFAIEKALYGSSLSVADYEALLNGQDIPEVRATNVEPTQHQEKTPPKVIQDMPDPVVSETPDPIAPVYSQQYPAPIVPIPAPVPISTSPGYGGGAPVAQQSHRYRV